MSGKMIRQPAYSLHKASGQARVRINRRDHYLGLHGSPESYERYQDLIAEWRIRNGDTDRYTLTVDDLALLYLDYAKLHYRKNGRETFGSALHPIRTAVFGGSGRQTRARSFGPKLLKEVRERMVSAKLCRTTINSNVGRIRRMFKWAVAEELIPPTVLTALQRSRAAGRAQHCNRTSSGRPVSQAAIDAIHPFVSRPVWAMVQVQLLTGMRRVKF